MGYRVKTASVVAYLPNGSQSIFYQGAPLPDGISDEEVKRLEEGGFIESDSASSSSRSSSKK